MNEIDNSMDLENLIFRSECEHRYEEDDEVILQQQPLNIFLAEDLFQLRGNEMAIAVTNCESGKLKGKRTMLHFVNY